MKSRLLILAMFLLSIAFVGQALGATLVPTPNKVPTGAYVNGPGGATDDNPYWQMLTLTMAQIHATGTTFNVFLPSDMTVADVDNDGSSLNDISYNWVDADAGSELKEVVATTITSNNQITFTLPSNLITPATPDADLTGNGAWVIGANWSIAAGAANWR